MSEVKIPCRPEKHRGEDTAAESGEVAPLLGDSSVAMMEQQFPGYYSVYGGVSYPRQYCIIYDTFFYTDFLKHIARDEVILTERNVVYGIKSKLPLISYSQQSLSTL